MSSRVDGSDDTSVAPGRGHDAAAAADDALGLPLGTRLGEFELTGRIGEGGFSIVYAAWDHSLDRQVAIKEYMPVSLAARVDRTRVSARSGSHRETFDAGLKSFINEAKLLARFDHPSLVKVYRFWEANGTAYMVMPRYAGTTLKDTVRAMAAPPDEAWLRALLAPLMQALDVIHAEQCYHRDIAPDNVILLGDRHDHPLLLDFGAARRVIGDMTQALTVILKPGYAPVEQYAEVPGLRQGPWTDVYALAAALYWAITGRTPPPSVGRMMRDSHMPLAQCAGGRYSAGFLAAIDRALIVAPDARTQTIAEFRRELGLTRDEAPGTAARRLADPDATVIVPPRPALPSAPTPTHGTGTLGPPPITPPAATLPTAPPRTTPGDPPAPRAIPRSRTSLVLGAGAVGLALLAGGAWWATRTSAPPAASPPAAQRPAEPATPNGDAVRGATSPDTAPVERAPTATAPTSPTAPMSTPPVEAAPPAPARPIETPPPAATPQDREPAPAATGAPPVQRTPPPPRTPKSADRTGAPAAVRSDEAAAHKAECARIFQRLSLGEQGPDLMERARVLNCR